MKSRILIFAFIAALTTLSCKKECNCTDTETLSGTWHMKSVYGGLAGVNLTYTAGEVQWNFDQNTNKLVVVNNILTTGPKSVYARFASGAYNYSVSQNNGVNVLTVDTVKVGNFSFASGKLMLDDGLAVDGFMTEFER